jgi:hypothetical protein
VFVPSASAGSINAAGPLSFDGEDKASNAMPHGTSAVPSRRNRMLATIARAASMAFGQLETDGFRVGRPPDEANRMTWRAVWGGLDSMGKGEVDS